MKDLAVMGIMFNTIDKMLALVADRNAATPEWRLRLVDAAHNAIAHPQSYENQHGY
jgi:hypothetical protein